MNRRGNGLREGGFQSSEAYASVRHSRGNGRQFKKDRFDTERTNIRKRCSQGGRHTDTLTVAPGQTLFTFYHVPFPVVYVLCVCIVVPIVLRISLTVVPIVLRISLTVVPIVLRISLTVVPIVLYTYIADSSPNSTIYVYR